VGPAEGERQCAEARRDLRGGDLGLRGSTGAYYPDSLHADRFVLIGASARGRVLYVVHAEVHEDHIRIISARKATTHEKTHYAND
jgi:uncharacterized DUF497 family protein